MEDTQRVEAALRSLGISDEAIATARERGDPGGLIFDKIVLPAVEQRTVTPAEIVARGGLDVEQVGRIMAAFGLPVPAADHPTFTEEEAEVYVALKRLEQIWPTELGVQVSRVYGRMLARIAQAETQLFRVFVEPQLRAEGVDPLEALQTVQEVLSELLDLTEPLILGVHRRWVEHYLAQAAVGEAEAVGLLPDMAGAVRVSLLFVDLKDFTAYAYDVGDAVAVEAIARFAGVVDDQRGPARFNKALGDGYMLAYADTGAAVSAGARIVAGMRAPGLPLVHASAHRGVAIAREGDYFGRVVNLASRLLTIAGGDELIATREVVEDCGPEFGWQPAGDVTVRGVAEPVDVFSLRGDALDALRG
jgi:adenylate cyclase